ncbi:MAG: N-acetylglucosamine-6-phosphate deacetylase [Roseburia sp.]|jgi:N-acetylglucosamine-6-phosphate deacetylase|nr:N-acetylglucosamine-6-phosphate deacetylase [Roseburia sp.]
MRIINGDIYADHRFVRGTLEISQGKITRLLPDDGVSAAAGEDAKPAQEAGQSGEEIIDARGLKVVPGFLDIHTHGAVGIDVNAATADDFEKIGMFFAENGTTAWLASVLTDTVEQTEWCIRQYLACRDSCREGAELLGIHLEGPFLSSAYKGAMPEELLQKGNADLAAHYQKLAEGGIRYMTVSPEVEGVIDMIPDLKELGITVAIGHSGADYDTAMRAIVQGAAASTHTGNAMRLLHQHEPAIWGAALESDIYCEMICDGRHLHPGTVRLYVKTKGTDRVVAVSDSIMAAGLPDGNYRLGVNDIVVKDGDARLAAADVRAGSTLTSDVALKNLLAFTGRPLEEVLPMMTENPARLIGVYDRKGSIADGKDADLVLLDEKNEIAGVIVRGKLVKKTL